MKHNKQKIFLIVLVSFVILAGCSKEKGYIDEGNTEAEAKGDAYFYDLERGAVYSDLSDNFDIKVDKWQYYYDEEAKQDRIILSIAIKNKTGKRLNDFVGVILFNEEASPLITSGMIRYDIFEPHDLIPKTSANGVIYAFDTFVEKDELLEEINADKDELLNQIRYFTLELNWKGGDETIDLVLDELIKGELN